MDAKLVPEGSAESTSACGCNSCNVEVHSHDHDDEGNREKIMLAISGTLIVLGGLAALFSYVIESAPEWLLYVESLLFFAAAVAGLIIIFPMAIHALKSKKIDMNVLMSIAVISALGLGVFAEAAIVIFLNQVGELLESLSMRKTKTSIKNLTSLAPETAHVVKDEKVQEVELDEIFPGATLRIHPGERVPLDGVITRGNSAFDESFVTGESVPVDKGIGSKVYGGTLNTEGLIEVEVTSDESESMLARVVKMVEEAQSSQAPRQKFIDKFASYYTPAVVISAIIVATVPPILTMAGLASLGTWSTWIYRAVTLLIISCPCALVISTPVTFVSAISRAAKSGVLVKGGAYLEAASKIKALAFDKTGTLTYGNPVVADVDVQEDYTEKEVLQIASALESHSLHPLAQAIVEYAGDTSNTKVTNIEEIAGGGIIGKVDNKEALIGNLEFLKDRGVQFATETKYIAKRASLQGAAIVAVAHNGKHIGTLYLADTIREETPRAIEQLKRRIGIKHIEMLTGDNEYAAQFIANKAGINHIQHGLLPQDKIERVKKLGDEYEYVAMVGDGVNDAPALAKADVGITMGAAASDTALEVADVALLGDGLKQLPGFFNLSKRAMTIVTQNVFLAIATKLIVFVLAILGQATMWMAVFADTGITIIVILNGMRLLLGGKDLK